MQMSHFLVIQYNTYQIHLKNGQIQTNKLANFII